MLGGKEKKKPSIYIEEGDGAVHSFLNSVKAITFQEGTHGAGVSAQLLQATFLFPRWS